MFHSAYQDGESVEVFTPAGKDPAVAWDLRGKVGRLYDKGVKGYVLAVSGNASSKMQIPKTPRGTLGLRQRHLVVQVLTSASPDKTFSLELGVTDSGGTRRRLVLSSSFRTLHCTPLHAQIPLQGLERHRGCWANLSVDLAGLTSTCFRANTFRALDLLAVGPTCRIRKIFTMRGALEASDECDVPGPGRVGNQDSDSAPVEPLPLRMAFPGGVNPPPRNWVISPATLRAFASQREKPTLPNRPAGQVSPASRSSHTCPADSKGLAIPSARSDAQGKTTPSPRCARRIISPTPESTSDTYSRSRQSSSASRRVSVPSPRGIPSPRVPTSRSPGYNRPLSSTSRPASGGRGAASDRRKSTGSQRTTSSISRSTVSDDPRIPAGVGGSKPESGLPARRRLAATWKTGGAAANAGAAEGVSAHSFVDDEDDPGGNRSLPRKISIVATRRRSVENSQQPVHVELEQSPDTEVVDMNWSRYRKLADEDEDRVIKEGKERLSGRIKQAQEVAPAWSHSDASVKWGDVQEQEEKGEIRGSPFSVTANQRPLTLGSRGATHGRAIVDPRGAASHFQCSEEPRSPRRPKSRSDVELAEILDASHVRRRASYESGYTPPHSPPLLPSDLVACEVSRDRQDTVTSCQSGVSSDEGDETPRTRGSSEAPGFLRQRCISPRTPASKDCSEPGRQRTRGSSSTSFPSHLDAIDGVEDRIPASARVDTLQSLLRTMEVTGRCRNPRRLTDKQTGKDAKQLDPGAEGMEDSPRDTTWAHHDTWSHVKDRSIDALERLVVASNVPSNGIAMREGSAPVPSSGDTVGGLERSIDEGRHLGQIASIYPGDVAGRVTGERIEPTNRRLSSDPVVTTGSNQNGFKVDDIISTSRDTSSRVRRLLEHEGDSTHLESHGIAAVQDEFKGSVPTRKRLDRDDADIFRNGSSKGGSLRRTDQERHRVDVDELKDKELVLVKLEASFQSEFGSLSSSRCSDTVAPDGDDNHAPLLLHQEMDGGDSLMTNPDDQAPQVEEIDIRCANSDADGNHADSVALSSLGGLDGPGRDARPLVPVEGLPNYRPRIATKRLEPGMGTGKSIVEGDAQHGSCTSRTLVERDADDKVDSHIDGTLSNRTAYAGDDIVGSKVQSTQPKHHRKGEATHALTSAKDNLWFDPILNCFYDKEADEYYGLT